MNNLRPLLKVIRTVDDGINRGYVTRIFPKTWKPFLIWTGLAVSGLLLSVSIVILCGGMIRNSEYKHNLAFGDSTYAFRPNNIYYEDQISKAEYYEYGFDKIGVERFFDKDALTSYYEIQYLIPKYKDSILLSDIDFELPHDRWDFFVKFDFSSYDIKFPISKDKRNELISLITPSQYSDPYELIFDKDKIDEEDYKRLELLGTVKPLHQYYPLSASKFIILFIIPIIILLYLIYLMVVEYEVKSIEEFFDIEDRGKATHMALVPFAILLLNLFATRTMSISLFIIVAMLYGIIAVSAKYTVKKKTESQW